MENTLVPGSGRARCEIRKEGGWRRGERGRKIVKERGRAKMWRGLGS